MHKHPYLRYDYILEGRIQVTNFVTGKVDIASPELSRPSLDLR